MHTRNRCSGHTSTRRINWSTGSLESRMPETGYSPSVAGTTPSTSTVLEVHHAGHRQTVEATAILERRQQVCRDARARHPKRWSGENRNEVLPEKV